MSDWTLTSNTAIVGVSRRGGQLGPVRFRAASGWLEPMHQAPWLAEPGAAGEPMLQNLQGDFFCAPFGESDLLKGETRAHGLTANGEWRELEVSADRVVLTAAAEVSGATVTKEVYLRQGQPVVYQVHRLAGGRGSLPIGHHAMLQAPEGDSLNLSFAPYEWAGTPSGPLEADPARGRSRLRYPQRIGDLAEVLTTGGELVDLTSFPALDDSEELLMLITDRGHEFAWSAAVAVKSRWIWFALRPNHVLRNTVIWLSNGGRYYPPFSRRHRRVIGLEETTSYFHLGHRASVEPNELNQSGYPTAVDLDPDGAVSTRYAFGAVTGPAGFERVQNVRLEAGHIVMSDPFERVVEVPFDDGFLHDAG